MASEHYINSYRDLALNAIEDLKNYSNDEGPERLMVSYRGYTKDLERLDNTRPAPAATDTGLETVAWLQPLPVCNQYGWLDAMAWQEGEFSSPVVTRSQADELLAAERARAAEKERLRFEGDLDKWMKIIGAGITGYQPEAYALMDLACQELVKLRTDNAAHEARLKELEEYAREATKAITGLTGGGSENFSKEIGDVFTADLPYCLERIRERYVSKVELKRLEAKLAAAETFIKLCADGAFVNDPRLRGAARAVLGGEPS